MTPENESAEIRNTIIFNASKQEKFKLNDNYKHFQRKLKAYWRIFINRELLSMDTLKNCSLLILPTPQAAFEELELQTLQFFLENGGRILVLLAESDQSDASNINILLENYGIVPNIDCLVRTHYYKYFHPKECFIGDSQFNTVLNKEKHDINLVYPFGCTMSVSKPSVVAFTSGFTSFPIDRPLGALYYNQKSGGRLVAIGSGYMFSDKYIDQENNDNFREAIIDFLVNSSSVHFAPTDHDDSDYTDYNIVPDTGALAERPKLCLTDAISNTSLTDYMKLFDHKMYSMNTSCIPEVLKLYDEVGIKHQTLKIISPKFESPFPPLQAAVFPPTFRELPPPCLELFDLDDAFSSVFSKLAQFTNKHNGKQERQDNDGLDFFVRECSKIVGVEGEKSAENVLYEIGCQISKFKSADTIK